MARPLQGSPAAQPVGEPEPRQVSRRRESNERVPALQRSLESRIWRSGRARGSSSPGAGSDKSRAGRDPSLGGACRMLQTAHMAATIGPNDVDLYESPLPDLLHKATRITPVEAGGHVLLDDLGVQSAQRLGIGDVGGNVVAAL